MGEGDRGVVGGGCGCGVRAWGGGGDAVGGVVGFEVEHGGDGDLCGREAVGGTSGAGEDIAGGGDGGGVDDGAADWREGIHAEERLVATGS